MVMQIFTRRGRVAATATGGTEGSHDVQLDMLHGRGYNVTAAAEVVTVVNCLGGKS